jgi:hypothetical protein
MFDTIKRKWKYRKTWGTPVGKDCVSLDDSLCTWLGTRLIFLSEHTRGYPIGCPTPDIYVRNLRKHGNALLRYRLKYECDLNGEAEIIKHAQEALTWVTKMLPALWD